MPAITDYLENKLIDFLFRGQPYEPPTTLYFALLSSDATEAGGGTEFSGGGYARVGVAASMINFSGTQSAGSTDISNGDSGKTSNNAAIPFPAPAIDWGTATHIGVFDAETDGNMLFYGKLSSPKLVKAGVAPKLKKGGVIFTLDVTA